MSALNRNAVKLALPALFEAMADPKCVFEQSARHHGRTCADLLSASALPNRRQSRSGSRSVTAASVLSLGCPTAFVSSSANPLPLQVAD